MTTSIEKYEKRQLAVLAPDKLARAVDAFVNGMSDHIADTGKKLSAAMRMRREYTGSNPQEVGMLRASVELAKKEFAKAKARLNGYVEEQRALFASRGMDPDRFYTWAIIPIGEVTPGGKEKCRMVERGVTFEANDISDDKDRSVVATIRLPSEKSGIERDQQRGKYNDAGFLIEEAVCGIDQSEINGTD